MSSETEEETRYRKHFAEQRLNNIEGNSVSAKMNKQRIKKHAAQWNSAEEAWEFFADSEVIVADYRDFDPMEEANKHLRKLDRLFGYLRWYYDDMGGFGMGHCKIIFQSFKTVHDRICIRVLMTETTTPDFFTHLEPDPGKWGIDDFERVFRQHRKNLIEAITRCATVRNTSFLNRRQIKANNRLFFALLDEVNRYNVIVAYFTKRIGLAYEFQQIETTKINWPTRSVWKEIAKKKSKSSRVSSS